MKIIVELTKLKRIGTSRVYGGMIREKKVRFSEGQPENI
jgi:hypothetical protein